MPTYLPMGSPLRPGIWAGENLFIRHPNARLSAKAIVTPEVKKIRKEKVTERYSKRMKER